MRNKRPDDRVRREKIESSSVSGDKKRGEVRFKRINERARNFCAGVDNEGRRGFTVERCKIQFISFTIIYVVLLRAGSETV